jgi:hypothetical protein
MKMNAEATPQMYRIRVRGNLDSRWAEWLASLSIVSEPAPDGCPGVVLTGPLPDQAALRGVLTKLWDLNLDIISVTRIATREEGA